MMFQFTTCNLTKLLSGCRYMIYPSDIRTKQWQKKCDTLGEVVHTPDTLVHDGGRFIWIRVTINISLPLCRGCLISIDDGRQVWVSFEYERLPNICYWCGCLDHDNKNCDVWIASEGTLKTEQQQLGPSLRACVCIILEVYCGCAWVL